MKDNKKNQVIKSKVAFLLALLCMYIICIFAVVFVVGDYLYGLDSIILTVGIAFIVFAVVFATWGIIYFHRTVTIDEKTAVVKNVFGKVTNSCVLAEIKEVKIEKNYAHGWLYVLIDDRNSPNRKSPEKQQYVKFLKSPKSTALVKTFWKNTIKEDTYYTFE